MAGSLRDQLLKAGLVTEEQVAEADKERDEDRRRSRARKPAKKHRKGKAPSLAQAYAERARLEQQERDRELNRRREEQRRRREQNQRLQALVKPAAVDGSSGEATRFFEWSGKIRKVYVTADQRTRLNRGELGIVHLKGRFYVVPAEIVEKARAIRAEAVAFFAPDEPEREEDADIPDDLDW